PASAARTRQGLKANPASAVARWQSWRVGDSEQSDRWDFFVSYTDADRDWAAWIAWTLEAAGFRVALQAWDMPVGLSWPAAMDRMVRRADRTVAVLSEAYVSSSQFGAVEWLAAFRRDPLGVDRRLIPVRVEDFQVDGLLAGVVRVDLFGL